MKARLAYVNAALGILVQGPTGASSHVRALTRALSRQSTCQLFSSVNVDRRGWYGAPVAAVTGAAAGWPSWLRSFRELREVRSAPGWSMHLQLATRDTARETQFVL